ncbi:MAG: beta-glucosidase [Armatimonadetes bacterium]|nr:beta-glucosidase [Anaerolineae bacterium]
MAFPKQFAWGTATSSYQIEGGGLDYGRSETIWDRFARTPGKVANGDTGDVACDHIHRYRDDIQLMRTMGVDVYRFSIAWARIFPAGTGAVNQPGLDFYSSVVDTLLEVGITPYVTLYHWDLPQALQDRGGWENPDSIGWYTDYTDLVTRTLGDRVTHWITHNEPYVIAMLGNLTGLHAPGKQDPAAAYAVAHHVLLSHGAAVPVIRRNVAQAQVGITLDQTYSYPYSNRHEDRMAARRFAAFHNDWFLDPVFRGTYPADLVKHLEPTGALAKVDVSAIAGAHVPLDFLGINYYTRNIIAHDASDPLLQISYHHMPDKDHTAMGWEVYPDGLLHTLVYLHNAYNPPAIYITENGCAYTDPAPADGVVQDPERTRYVQLHLDAVSQAIDLGVPVAGYFAWSFMDNFEWAEGYDKRFGLYHVDFETQQRTPKASALYYRDRIATERAG